MKRTLPILTLAALVLPFSLGLVSPINKTRHAGTAAAITVDTLAFDLFANLAAGSDTFSPPYNHCHVVNTGAAQVGVFNTVPSGVPTPIGATGSVTSAWSSKSSGRLVRNLYINTQTSIGNGSSDVFVECFK